MEVRRHGVRQVEGAFAAKHLQADPEGAVSAEIFEIDLADENVRHGQFVALLSRERIKRELRSHAPQPPVSFNPDLPPSAGVEVVTSPPDDRWHLSIEGKHRPPTVSEAYRIATRVRPGVLFVLRPDPRPIQGVHLWEISDANLEELWRA